MQMAEGPVTVRTRKFVRNPLLQRRQMVSLISLSSDTCIILRICLLFTGGGSYPSWTRTCIQRGN